MKDFLKFVVNNIITFILRLMQFIVPIKGNRIVFASYSGEQYSGNPKYISEYLLKKYDGKFEIIWLFLHPEQYGDLDGSEIKIDKYNFFNRAKYILTSKAIIINSGNMFCWAPQRKGQLRINTWHGGGYYKLTGGSEKEKNYFYKRNLEHSSKHTSYFLSTNRCFTEHEIREDFYYQGKVLNIGFPRNDIFFHGNANEIRKKVCSYFNINEKCKIMMYAPTYRYNKEAPLIIPDFEKLKQVVSQHFGGDWVVLTRMHYVTKFNINNKNTVDANYHPGAPDMQELLMSCDILISDYSSCIWDYSFTYRPCFLFTPDLKEYTADRGFGIDIYKWGFPVCETEQELYEAVKNFDKDVFRKSMDMHHESLGSFEKGNACEIMGQLIYNYCYPENRKIN